MKNAMKLLQITFLGSVVLLQACGSAEKKGDVSDSFGDTSSGFNGAGSDIVDNSRVQHDIGNAAVVAIWERAEEFRLTGDYEGAISQLERAIRIDPTDPVIWSRMAELRLQQGNYIAAENIATKSNQLNNARKPVLEYRNWLIIAQAREANGDASGAQLAQQRANAFR